MPIKFAQTAFTGVSGITPNLVFIDTNDTIAQVTAAGYLNKLVQEHMIDLQNGYMALVNTQLTPAPSSQKSSSLYTVSITGTPGNFTYSLVEPTQAGGAIFPGIIQSGLPGGPAGGLILYSATPASGRLGFFPTANSGDFFIRVTNAPFGEAATLTIPDPGAATANFIMSNSAATQHITTSGLQLDDGALISGISTGGFVGALQLFPTTATTGSFSIHAIPNGGNFAIVVQNAAFGQASTLTVPDPGGAAASFNMSPAALVSGNLVKASGTAGLTADAGFFIKANTTAAYAGGGTSNAFAANGLTATSIVTAVILTSTNAVAIAKAVPSANVLTVTFTADPGAGTTVSWIATSAAV